MTYPPFLPSGAPTYATTARGRMATAVGLFLIWYAAWTCICNVAVLAGVHFATLFPQVIAIPTLLTLAVSRRMSRTAMAYDGALEAATVPVGFPKAWRAALAIVIAGTAAVMAANAFKHGSIVSGAAPRWNAMAAFVVVATAGVAAWVIGRGKSALRSDASEPAQGWWRYVALLGVFLALYYFGHRQDEDESNFINLALGAQRTHGAIYQFDTMLGDGPHAIHLATYRLHSFELLVASISSLLHISPIVVAHLLLPAPQLMLIAGVAWLLLEPIVGRRWLAAGLMVPAFLLVDTQDYSTWGLQGIVRLFEGKALLVTAIVPLIAGLTVRWFERGLRSDLVALGLAQACAVGLSANGLYLGPFASGFVALAYVATRRTPGLLRRALALLPTLAYPVVIAGIILLLHLSHPSELLYAGTALGWFFAVAGAGNIGIAMLIPIMLLGIGLAHTKVRSPAAAYIPLIFAVTLNPVSWAAISAFTGKLGFRIFWAVPVPMMTAALLTVVAMRAGVRREVTLIGMATSALVGAIWFNHVINEPRYVVHWHMPTLKVDSQQYSDARALATLTYPHCAILAPETVSQWLSTIDGAPYPVFTRRLYLEHYRYTMPEAERAARVQLADVVEKGTTADRIDLRQLGRFIGTLAIMRDNGPNPAIVKLARRLRLPGPAAIGDMLVWHGDCGRQ